MKSMISLAIIVLTSSMGFAGGGSSVGLGNPAAEHCEALGGAVEIKETQSGQLGICVIEEWQLFRKMFDAGLTVEHTYQGIGMPNPASVNCIDAGGELKTVVDTAGEVGMCLVDEWKLYSLFH